MRLSSLKLSVTVTEIVFTMLSVFSVAKNLNPGPGPGPHILTLSLSAVS